MYTIEVNYKTGNSFGSEDCTDTIGLVWESKELARKALAALSSHYKLYKEKDSYFSDRSDKEIYKEVKACSWYFQTDEEKGSSYGNNSYSWWYICKVELDDGSFRNLPTGMWCGYFESLYSARITTDVDDEDEVFF